MSQYKEAEIGDTVYFWFAANTTAGAAGDGADPLYDVRLAGAAAGAAPTASGTPTLLSHANYTDGLHEIAIDTTGYAAGEYAVFCTLTISTVNPAGFCGSFRLKAAGASIHSATTRVLLALPAVAPDGAGGLPISDTGGLDLDTLLGRLDATITSRHASGAAVAKSPATLAVGDVTGNLPVDIKAYTVQPTVTGATLDGAYDPAKTAAQAGDEMDLVNAPNATAVTAIRTEMEKAGTTLATLLARVVGTILAGNHTAQSGDAYGVVNNGTYGNSALKTLIDTIDDYLDTEIATIITAVGTTLINHLLDIKGTGFVKDTHSLPQCLTATGFSTHSAADVKTAIEAAGSYLALIKAILDKQDTMVELDGVVYRFTTNALEQSPTGSGGFTADDRTTLEAIPTLSEIEATAVLAKQAKLDTLHDTRIPGVIQPQTGDSFGRLGAPAGASISADIAAVKDKILEIYELYGLDPTKPLVVSQTSRQAGTITQSISTVGDVTTVTRT